MDDLASGWTPAFTNAGGGADVDVNGDTNSLRVRRDKHVRLEEKLV